MARTKAASQAGIEFYTDTANKWRWRLRSDNGNIIAASAEGYNRISGAKNGAQAVVDTVRGLDVPAAPVTPRKARTVKARVPPALSEQALLDVERGA